MGAKKTVDTYRNKFIHVKCTENERLEFQEKARKCGMTVADLIRKSVENTETWTAKDKELISKFLREFSKVGNNINQIARWANTEKSGIETLQIIAELQIIKEQLEELKEVFNEY